MSRAGPWPSPSSKVKPLPTILTVDDKCRSCGYSLQGLPSTGVCPECGTKIRVKRSQKRFGTSLVDAPVRYLYRLQWTCLALVVCGLGASVFILLAGKFVAAGIAATLFCAGWLVAVYILTGPPPMDMPGAEVDSGWNRRLAATCRILQSFWMLGAIMTTTRSLVAYTGWSRGQMLLDGASIIASVLTTVAIFGIVPLSIHMANLADWARNTTLGDRLRGVAWVILVCGVVSQVGTIAAFGMNQVPFLAAVGGVVLVVAMIATPLFLIAQLVFLYSLLSVFNMARWAAKNAEHQLYREEKLKRKAARKLAQAQAEPVRVDQARAWGPDPSAPPDDSPIPLADEPEPTPPGVRPPPAKGGTGQRAAAPPRKAAGPRKPSDRPLP